MTNHPKLRCLPALVVSVALASRAARAQDAPTPAEPLPTATPDAPAPAAASTAPVAPGPAPAAASGLATLPGPEVVPVIAPAPRDTDDGRWAFDPERGWRFTPTGGESSGDAEMTGGVFAIVLGSAAILGISLGAAAYSGHCRPEGCSAGVGAALGLTVPVGIVATIAGSVLFHRGRTLAMTSRPEARADPSPTLDVQVGPGTLGATLAF